MSNLSDLSLEELQEYRDVLEKNRKRTGTRERIVARFGYDVKFASHVVRLVDQAEQVLSEGTLDLQRSRKVLASIRRGEWTLDDIRDYFSRGEKVLLELYNSSKLRHRPDEQAIKNLLLACLEAHYGSLSKVVVTPERERQVLQQIMELASTVLYK